MNVADWMVRCMEDEGVRYVFGVPGEETLALLDAIRRSPRITFVATRHEAGAAFMAAGYARLTLRAQVALATLGPGATNLLTGVANANLDHTPLVAISGQSSLGNLHLPEFHQVLNLSRIYREATRFQERVERPEAAPDITIQAFSAAHGDPPGAAFIELPSDVSFLPIDDPGPFPRHRRELPIAAEATLDEAARLWREAGRPLMLVGNAVARAAGAADALRDLAEATGAPFTTTFMAKGALDDRLPGSFPTLGTPGSESMFDEADLVIAIGYETSEIGPSAWNHRRLPIVHLAETPPQADLAYRPVALAIGELTHTLRGLARRLEPFPPSPDLIAWRERGHAQHAAVLGGGADRSGRAVIRHLRALIPEDALLVSDVGLHKMLLARHYPVYRPGTLWITNGLSAMGFAVPAAMGALLADPGRRVVALVGDGGLLMSLGDLETLVRLALPLSIVVLADGGYGLIREHQERHGLVPFGVEFTNPRWRELGEAFGIPTQTISRESEIVPGLERALSQPGASLTVIETTYR